MIALLKVSCQQKTKEESGEEVKAIGNDIEQKLIPLKWK